MNKELYTSYNILKKVYLEGAFAGAELNKLSKVFKDEMNTALVTNIVYGVIEKDIYLDYVISQFVKGKTDETIKLILKIGAFVKENIASIPNFACVNELVEITKKYANKYASGFVNATLKNIYQSQVTLPSDNDLLQYLSVRYSYPKWIIEKLLITFGKEFAEGYLNEQLTELTHIRVVKELDFFIAELEKCNITLYKSSYLPNTFYVDYERLVSEKHLEKHFVVQGLPSILAGLSVDIQPKNRVLDLCSAPGGKAVLLAQTESTATVTANDIYPHKIQLIKKYADKYGIKNIKTSIHDATTFNKKWQDYFDAVLCDVPCSNTGIASKKPDILLNKTLEHLQELVSLQTRILENAANYVKAGGTLVYSTCSILKEENTNVVENFLRNNRNFTLQPVNTQGIEVIKTHEMCEFYPNISKTEGFFIAKMTKKVE